MDVTDIRRIIADIDYKPHWFVNVYPGKSNVEAYIQLEVTIATDSVTGEKTGWKGAKRHVSEWMCRQEIVGMVYGMIEAAEIHEMREFFRYKGRSIYNPHIDPDALVELASKAENFNCRENSMSMEEE